MSKNSHITADKIEQDKEPETREVKPTLIEGSPDIGEVYKSIYADVGRHKSPYLLRRLYGALHGNLLREVNDDLMGRTKLLSYVKLLMQGIANYGQKHPDRLPELCAALAGSDEPGATDKRTD